MQLQKQHLKASPQPQLNKATQFTLPTLFFLRWALDFHPRPEKKNETLPKLVGYIFHKEQKRPVTQQQKNSATNILGAQFTLLPAQGFGVLFGSSAAVDRE